MTRSGSLYVESVPEEEGNSGYTTDSETKVPNIVGNEGESGKNEAERKQVPEILFAGPLLYATNTAESARKAKLFTLSSRSSSRTHDTVGTNE